MTKTKILVVEDDGIIGRHIQVSLQKLGYEVAGLVTSGEDAVRQATLARPHLALMDISLQGEIDGIETAAIIRQEMDIPVIYLTAYSETALLERAKITDPFGYIVKPFEEHNLHATIEMALQKHQLEKRLREREAQLSSIFRAAPVGIGVVVERVFQWVNEQLCAMTGYPPDALLGQSARLLYPDQEEFERVGRDKYAQIEREGIGVVETRWLRADGQMIDVLLRSTPMEGGNLLGGVTFSALDISERKRSEHALRFSEEKFSKAFRTTPDALAITRSRDGLFIEINDGFTQIAGYTAEELAGKTSIEISVWVDDNARNRLIAQTMRDGQTVNFEAEFRAKDGRQFTGLMSAAIIEVNGETCILSITRDISERKKAEEALRLSEAFNRAVIEASPLGISVRDRFGRLLACNEAWKQIWAIPDDVAAEDMNRERNELRFDWRDSYLSVEQREALQNVYTQGGSLFLPELRTKGHRPGAVLWVSQHFYAITNSNGEVDRVVIITQDISERKTAEETIRRERDRAQQYLDIAGVIIIALDVQGTITLLNPKGCEILGYAPEEIIGQNWFDLCLDDAERQNLPLLFEKSFREGMESFEYHENAARTRSGERRLIAWHNSLVCDADGNPVGILSSGEDITERRLAEQAMRASEARYRSLFEDSPISMWQEDFSAVRRMLDSLREQAGGDLETYLFEHPEAVSQCMAQVVLRDVNQATLRMFQAGQKETLFENLDRVMGAETLDLFRSELIAIARGEVVFEGEGVNRDLAGNPLDVRLHWSVAPGAEQTLADVIVSLSDITGQKQRERELVAIANMSIALRSAETRAAIVEVTLQQVSEIFRADGAAFAQREARNGLRIETATGGWAGWQGRQFSAEHCFAKKVLEERRSFIADEQAAAQALTDGDVEAMGVKSLLCAPLEANEQAIGALAMGRQAAFTDADLRLFASIADMTGNALYRAALREEAQRHNEQMATVSAIGRALAETLDLPEIYHRLALAVLELLPGTATVLISIFDDETHMIRCVYGFQDGAPLDVRSLPLLPLAPEGQGTQSQVIRSRQPLIVAEQIGDRLRNPVLVGTSELKTSSALFAPMLEKGKVLGVIQAQSYQPNRYSQADADLLTLVANSAAVTIENASLLAETQLQLERLSALHAIDTAIASSFDVRVTLNILLDQIIALLGVDSASILQLNPYARALEFTCGRGYRAQTMLRQRQRLGEGIAGRAALDRRLVALPDISRESASLEWEASESVEQALNHLRSEGFLAYFAAPLVAKGQVKGILELCNRKPVHANGEWKDFLETLAGQAAIAMDNAALFDDLQRSNLELALAYDTTLEGWIRALDLRDKETEGHTLRVTDLTVRLATEMGFGDADLVHIRRGALLHDIGKIGVPDHILRKTGPLTDDEWVIMRQHPAYAYELLSPIAYLQHDLDIPYCHHEKWDGTGYPRRLQGQQIPLSARLFAIIDVWDALTSERPYRPAWPEEKALTFIRSQTSTHFDPDVVKAFIRMMGQDE